MPTTSRRRKNRLSVQFAVPRRGLPAAASFRRWVCAAARGREVTLRVVGAREGRALNRRFRKKDYPTNVLSFPYGKGAGDIVLCHPVVAREAREQGKTLSAHYAHLVIHGVLHLRGYDHGASPDATRMETAEIRLLRRFGLDNPYTVK
jgi:probable rRNA maturation factor